MARLFDANGARLFAGPVGVEITPAPTFQANGARTFDRDVGDARWQAVGVEPVGTTPALIPTLTALVGLYGAYSQIQRAAAPPPPPPLPPPIFPTAPGAIVPRIPAPVLRGGVRAAVWVARIIKRYGIVIAQAVWDAYQQYRIQGVEDKTAKHLAKQQHGVTDVGRRRINPTNVKALRRAIRRVRSFHRISRKVERLLPRRPGRAARRPWARGRRGDVEPFYAEDQADVYDEAEDLGYDPAGFDID